MLRDTMNRTLPDSPVTTEFRVVVHDWPLVVLQLAVLALLAVIVIWWRRRPRI